MRLHHIIPLLLLMSGCTGIQIPGYVQIPEQTTTTAFSQQTTTIPPAESTSLPIQATSTSTLKIIVSRETTTTTSKIPTTTKPITPNKPPKGIIEYDHNGHHIKLEIGNPLHDRYLIVGGGLMQGLHADAAFAAISMNDVSTLVQLYGDFQHCYSEGAFQSQKYVRSFLFLTKDARQAETVKALAKLEEKDKFPIIEVSAHEVRVLEDYVDYGGKRIPYHYSGDERQILIDSLNITLDNYKG
jgi:hypothetical protein